MNYSRRIQLCCVLICLLLLPSVGKSAAAADPSLVLHWKLDGDFRDISGNNNHGSATGSISFADGGAIGRYAIFSGGYVQVPASPSLNLGGQFSISVWLKLASDDAGRNPDVSLVAKENTNQQKN